MKKLLFSLAFVCSLSASSQVPDCNAGICAGVGAPSISCHPGAKYAQTDAPGTNWTCTGIPSHWVQDAGSGGSSASATLENIYAAPGSFTFAHGLNSLFNEVHCVTRTGGTYAPATWTDAPVDANDTSVTVPSAGDYICSFNASGTLGSDFSIATAPTTLLYEPTMTGTQHPTFTDTQAAISGYSGTVTYSTSGLASGMTGAFSPTTITGSGTNTLTLSFPASQTPATTAFTVSGTDGTKTHTASPSITVGNINQGLVDCWAMTDGSGSSVADSCATGNTETLATGTLTWQTNYTLPGTTPLFSATAYTHGTNQTATNFNGSTPFSVSSWVALSSVSGYHTIAGDAQGSPNYNGWEVSLSGPSGFGLFLVNSTGSNQIQVYCTAGVAANTLYYVAWTYDGSKTAAGVKIYVNGGQCSTTTGSDVLTGSIASTQNVFIGGRQDGSLPLNGVEAYTRIYNRVLSPTDVANYYAAGAR